jgi:hypothetical protein
LKESAVLVLVFAGGAMMRRLLIIASVATALIGFLADESHARTLSRWHARFGSGEARITIRNSKGEPIPGARVHVFERDTRRLTSPIDSYSPGVPLVSDRNGQFSLATRGGVAGGTEWQLFWLIPMGQPVHQPRYDVEITAPGYQPLRVDLHQIFHQPGVDPEKLPVVKRVLFGDERELRVFQHTFQMEAN